MKNALENFGYQFDVINDIWARPAYQSINYSDGDETENRIAEILRGVNDLSILSTELKSNCVDWVSTYHLSSARSNILRPFDHILNGQVLEVGAGCGAITRYLGESGAQILALEGSLRRAGIAKLRTRDLENVTVLSESFNEFKTSERFDVITLIGVLEYANLFVPGDDPAITMLERVKSLLKPDGKLIIAIENQLGLKYFAGAPEDHLGIPMFGIEGQYHNASAKTYGKKSLEELLRVSGFKNSQFLAPFPDYKLPVSIVTESGFKNKKFDASAFAWQSVGRDPNLPKSANFSMELAWPQIFDNDLALDMSNSFLVVASHNDANAVEPGVLAYHYNVGRIKEYCKETKFKIDGDDQISVMSAPLQGEHSLPRRTHDEIIYQLNGNEKYTHGEPLSYTFFQIIGKPGWTLDELVDFVTQYIAILERLLARNGYVLKVTSSNQLIPGVYFDALPQNIIQSSDGDFVFIDEEWSLSSAMTIGHLLFRALFWMVGQASKIAKNESLTHLNRIEFVEAILKASNIHFSSEEVDCILNNEQKVQHHISGVSPIAYFDSLKNLPVLRLNSSELALQNKELMESLERKISETQNEIDSILKSNVGMLILLSRRIKKKIKPYYLILKNIKKYSQSKDSVWSIFTRAYAIYSAYGLSGLVNVLQRIKSGSNIDFDSGQFGMGSYADWVRKYKTLSKDDESTFIKKIQAFKVTPLVSILMPTYNANAKWLNKAIESIRGQIYANWELCIVDDASTDPAIRSVLEKWQSEDPRIKVVFREKNGHISESSNTGLELASGEWIALLDHDDLLSPDALFWVVDMVNRHSDCCLIYSDEDKIDENDARFDPYFKPDWSPELFYSQNLISHLGVYKTDLMRKIGGFRKGLEGSQDYDLALRFIENIDHSQIKHIPRVLYHWRAHPESTAQTLGAKPYAEIAGVRALNDHFQRQNISAKAEKIPAGYKSTYLTSDVFHKVSIVICIDVKTINAKAMLSVCKSAHYPIHEIVIVGDRDALDAMDSAISGIKLINSVRLVEVETGHPKIKAITKGVLDASGDFVCILSGLVLKTSSSWLKELMLIGIQRDVGCVGAKVVYKNNLVKNAGYILCPDGSVISIGHGLGVENSGYCGRLGLTQQFLAVSSELMLFKKSMFIEVADSMDMNQSIEFDDIDFCLRLRQRGKKCIWSPFSEIYLNEKMDYVNKAHARESQHLLSKWAHYFAKDPYFNPNLSIEQPGYVLACPPRP